MSAGRPPSAGRSAVGAYRRPVRAIAPGAIDIHAHLFPQSAVRAERDRTMWFGSTFASGAPDRAPVVMTGNRKAAMGAVEHREAPAGRLMHMDRHGIGVQVISLLPPLFRYELPAETCAAAARAVNDEIAEMSATWPDRFLGLATLPLQDTDLALAELERATEIGLLGVSIGTHVNGIDLDHERFRPVFRRAAELGCFVLCHPINPRLETALGRFYQSNVIGNPLETTLAFAALSQGGVFDDAPGLRICFVHGGGYIAAAVGRMSHAYDVRPELDRRRSRPDVHLHQVYVDSLTHDPVALRALAASVGVHRVLLGSDYPADMGVLDPLGAVRALGLPAQDEHAILRLNALEALRIDDVTPNIEQVTTGEPDRRLR